MEDRLMTGQELEELSERLEQEAMRYLQTFQGEVT